VSIIQLGVIRIKLI